MAYDHTALENNVRGLIPNITANQLSNAKIDQYGTYALRRLLRDKPRRNVYTLTGAGGKYYDLSTLINASVDTWIPGKSIITKMFRPTENEVATSRDIVMLYPKEYQLFPDATDHMDLFLVDALGATQTVTFEYTTPYVVDGIDGATATNVEDWIQTAIEFLTAAFACYALSAQAAGTTDSSMPGDIVAWRSKQQEYRRAGQSFEEQYAKEIGLNQPVIAGSFIADFDPLLQVGTTYVTHMRR